MRHFDIVQWDDYVRDLLGPADRTAMKEHLASGCQECAGAARRLRKLVAVADSEATYKAPGYAVDYVKAIHPLQAPERVHVAHNQTNLTYDSFREPLPAGIRSQGQIIRHTRYEAGDHSLDLRQEIARGRSRVMLVGQITNQKEPGGQMPDVAVILVSGKEIVARAVSNEFGEFLVAYEPKAHMKLYLQGNRAGRFLSRSRAKSPKGKDSSKAQRPPQRKRRARS